MATNSTSEPTKEEIKAAKKLQKAQEKMQKENVKARERIAKAALEVEREAGRVRMSGHERREQLINVARHLFAEKGYEAVSVEEIAQWASVSKPVIYEHFGSKEGLYAVILDRETRELLRTVISNMETGHPRKMLEQAVYAFFTYIGDIQEKNQCSCADKHTTLTSMMNILRWFYLVMFILGCIITIGMLVFVFIIGRKVMQSAKSK